MPKINKYGFIHVGKDVREKLDLPDKTDIELKLKVNEEDRTLTYTIKGVIEPKPKKAKKKGK